MDELVHSDQSKDAVDTPLKVTCPVNALFTDTTGYRTYRLENKDQTYNDRIERCISRMQKRSQVQMKEKVFDACSPITIMCFLKTLKTACH